VRQLIRDRPGVTRNEWIDLLKSAGFQSGADMTFDTQLDTELARMVRGGRATRTFEGGYLPKEAA
jgi:glucuronate isomerase